MDDGEFSNHILNITTPDLQIVGKFGGPEAVVAKAFHEGESERVANYVYRFDYVCIGHIKFDSQRA